MRIRPATEADAPGVTEIYNDAVAHTTAIWNDTLVDQENRRLWIRERLAAGFPVLVAVDEEDGVLGYATYGPWRPHDGYRRTVEHSVYVRDGQRGTGLGRALMGELLETARAQEVHVMVAGIDAENTGSIALHEKLGFVRTGLLPQVGIKFGRWLDLAFLQLTLDRDAAPEDR